MHAETFLPSGTNQAKVGFKIWHIMNWHPALSKPLIWNVLSRDSNEGAKSPSPREDISEKELFSINCIPVHSVGARERQASELHGNRLNQMAFMVHLLNHGIHTVYLCKPSSSCPGILIKCTTGKLKFIDYKPDIQ